MYLESEGQIRESNKVSQPSSRDAYCQTWFRSSRFNMSKASYHSLLLFLIWFFCSLVSALSLFAISLIIKLDQEPAHLTASTASSATPCGPEDGGNQTSKEVPIIDSVRSRMLHDILFTFFFSHPSPVELKQNNQERNKTK